MMTRLTVYLFLFIAVSARGQFQAFDVFVDSGQEGLAAYQLEFSATQKMIRIVGIEGGEHDAFKDPPFYDPKAMQHERVVLGAFSTARNLPTGKTRVATVHIQVVGTAPIDYRLTLHTAANSEGTQIPVTTTLNERPTNEPKN